MNTVFSKNGQVTIPKPLRDRFGLKPGQCWIIEKKKERLW
ncbi:MAG: AbrB/MazE/SpoVT family DNA-binding domain-containing protein [Nitrospirota bacterium]|nr:AbrB/MazE/SpoVT family DNA-binding domain-containing protein [Nitrospirota bacterium]MDH5587530.1 AbrB/MazE/SpoVT family DNA-binding domain-containing protein [Nitrospirota bacterium]MDH5775260.1 AbrB/MazE/SpoVT family DNA-binding domain-containing protein [Nitrospirota bacterium]